MADDAVLPVQARRGDAAAFETLLAPLVEPACQRFLLWDEPGTWPTGQYGTRTNEFFLESSGLTEGEFHQVAGSLQPVS